MDAISVACFVLGIVLIIFSSGACIAMEFEMDHWWRMTLTGGAVLLTVSCHFGAMTFRKRAISLLGLIGGTAISILVLFSPDIPGLARIVGLGIATLMFYWSGTSTVMKRPNPGTELLQPRGS